MSDVQLYLLEVDKHKAEASKIASQSASRLETKQLKLIDLVTSLEPYINNRDDASLRAKSVAYLAEVLSHIAHKVLSLQERRLLVDFILGRLEGDHEGLGASARALISLEALGNWDTDTAQKVMRTFIDYTSPLRQFKLQTERYAVAQLIDLLLAKYRTVIRQLHDDDHEFLPAFISYFEGEKDPRNLMIIFSMLQVPMAEWDVRAHAQDLFESVFNYFPITFKPPPDDPYGISAQDLKDRLRDCIAANSDFAPYAFPQLLDKLDSTSINTKRDVLQAIQECVVGYEVQTINLYSVTLWDALKFEILNVQEEDLAQEALRALSLIAAKFAQTSEGPLNAFLRPIIKECNEHLEDAPTKQSEAASRILHAISITAPIIADTVIQGAFPLLFKMYHGTESITKRRGLLEAANQVIGAYSKLDKVEFGMNVEALAAFSETAVAAMVRALVAAPKHEVSFRLSALTGLAQLISVQKALPSSQIELAVTTVTDIIIHEHIEGHGNIRPQAIKTLVDMAHAVPQVLQERAIPAFMVELPDVPDDLSRSEHVLEAFAQLATEKQLFHTTILRLKGKLEAARRQDAPATYQRSLLLALLYGFTFGEPIPARADCYRPYAIPLVDEFVRCHLARRDPAMCEIVGRICNSILRPQGVHFQSGVYHKDLSWMSQETATQTSVENLRSITPYLLFYYAALRVEVVEAEDIVALLQKTSAAALDAGVGTNGHGMTLRLLSLLVNKFVNPKTMQVTLEAAKLDVDALLTKDCSVNAIGVGCAIVKGLLLQGKSAALTTKYLQALLDQLTAGNREVAMRFTTLLAPDDVLTKENHCLISNLYKQKVFTQAVPFITNSVRNPDAQKKSNYLVALSGILRWLPYSIMEPSLPILLPPLLQTLDLDTSADQEVKASGLTIFESMLMHDPSVVAEHTASLVTRLLNCTTAEAGNHANVRAKALQCLALIPRQLKREAVVPYRRQVVKRLLACLDDAKRIVRAEAVKCRTAWLALDEGTDDAD
ncbi:hypothetical protein BAUCODRAFT_37132 [Baudoinia panamericana UAMH 10762]|uniref:MMS19 nucleotide excision repair protein n=1 Tax=Baudoinia panamericana (strain UAMH 10762) TaxID=717646 RepID=M2MPT2_BAUPA|nr:uncharacterized protein BAUCODRAFT_37132 [Baudoinia panamericana UAMH 10762]EMC93453.1 hypothetical protein BAUCODRAFT_37132 [Baudoinia panamericana UAMH 10762]